MNMANGGNMSQKTLSDADRILIGAIADSTGADRNKLESDFLREDIASIISSLPKTSLSEKNRKKINDILSDPKKSEAAKKAAEKEI